MNQLAKHLQCDRDTLWAHVEVLQDTGLAVVLQAPGLGRTSAAVVELCTPDLEVQPLRGWKRADDLLLTPEHVRGTWPERLERLLDPKTREESEDSGPETPEESEESQFGSPEESGDLDWKAPENPEAITEELGDLDEEACVEKEDTGPKNLKNLEKNLRDEQPRDARSVPGFSRQELLSKLPVTLEQAQARYAFTRDPNDKHLVEVFRAADQAREVAAR